MQRFVCKNPCQTIKINGFLLLLSVSVWVFQCTQTRNQWFMFFSVLRLQISVLCFSAYSDSKSEYMFFSILRLQISVYVHESPYTQTASPNMKPLVLYPLYLHVFHSTLLKKGFCYSLHHISDLYVVLLSIVFLWHAVSEDDAMCVSILVSF